MTIGGSNFLDTAFDVLLRETQGGQARELRKGDTPRRGSASIIPLYVGLRRP